MSEKFKTIAALELTRKQLDTYTTDKIIGIDEYLVFIGEQVIDSQIEYLRLADKLHEEFPGTFGATRKNKLRKQKRLNDKAKKRRAANTTKP